MHILICICSWYFYFSVSYEAVPGRDKYLTTWLSRLFSAINRIWLLEKGQRPIFPECVYDWDCFCPFLCCSNITIYWQLTIVFEKYWKCALLKPRLWCEILKSFSIISRSTRHKFTLWYVPNKKPLGLRCGIAVTFTVTVRKIVYTRNHVLSRTFLACYLRIPKK